jgi:hypothetical protein
MHSKGYTFSENISNKNGICAGSGRKSLELELEEADEC